MSTSFNNKGAGLLISLDGIDKSGKTCQALMLCKGLEKLDLPVQLQGTRLDTNPINLLLRGYMDGQQQIPIPPKAMAYLFAASGVVQQETTLLPLITAGTNVIRDRYVYSGYAYNIAMGIGDRAWNEQIFSYVVPANLAIYIEVSVETALKRKLAEKKSWDIDRLETGFLSLQNQEEAFILTQTKVRNVYLDLVREGKMILIDGERDKETIYSEVFEYTRKLLM